MVFWTRSLRVFWFILGLLRCVVFSSFPSSSSSSSSPPHPILPPQSTHTNTKPSSPPPAPRPRIPIQQRNDGSFQPQTSLRTRMYACGCGYYGVAWAVGVISIWFFIVLRWDDSDLCQFFIVWCSLLLLCARLRLVTMLPRFLDVLLSAISDFVLSPSPSVICHPSFRISASPPSLLPLPQKILDT